MGTTDSIAERSPRSIYEALRRRTIEAGARLKPSQKMFVDHWIANGGNATQAYRDATDYKGKQAGVLAYRMLQRKKVAEYARLVQECTAYVVIDAASCNIKRAFDEEARLAYLDPRLMFNDDGSIKPPKEWPEELARCISGVDIDEVVAENGAKRTKYRVRFWNKGESLNRIQKCLGMQREPQAAEEEISLKALLSEIDGGTKGRLPSDLISDSD
jgi:hypothetical protein